MMKVGFLRWNLNSEITQNYVESIEALGHCVINFSPTDPIPPQVDLIFTHGPFGSLVPVVNQLVAMPRTERPLFVMWMSEQFWSPNLPTFLGHPLSRLRTFVERQAYQQSSDGLWRIKPGWQRLTDKGLRFRYYGDILWLQQNDIPSLIAIHSDWMHEFLKQRGLVTFVAHNGYAPIWGEKLNLERDIPVLWLGKPGSRRRRDLLQHIRRQLAERGIEMLVIDGYENPYVFGQERTHLLNRTQIVLNILRKPWDSNYLRYLLAMANGALIVTEPTYPHAPFKPGVHIAVAPPEKIAENIAYYLAHPAEREAITDQAYEFITTQFTLQQSITRLFEQIKRISEKKNIRET